MTVAAVKRSKVEDFRLGGWVNNACCGRCGKMHKDACCVSALRCSICTQEGHYIWESNQGEMRVCFLCCHPGHVNVGR